QILAMGAFTLSLWKDDLLAKPGLSLQIEKKREKEKYFLSSKVLGLGSLFSDGLPLYIKENLNNTQKVMTTLLNFLEEIAGNRQASKIVLRDFKLSNPYHTFFQGQGFIPVNMPEVCMV